MKILVMGAGYVGMALLKYFKNTPHEIFITTTHADRVDTLKHYGRQVLVLDPENPQELTKLIDFCESMIVMVAPTHSQSYEDTYLHTAKTISLALQSRQKPFYLLYTSSTSVCEGFCNQWVTEDMPLDPASANAKILLETEQCYLNSLADVCILRLGGIYGPNRELSDRARRFSGKEIAGTGEEPTNNIHLDDIVAALVFCLEKLLTGIYHLVNDEHTSRKNLYDNLCKSLEIPSPLWNGQLSGGRKGGHLISNQKIKDAGFIFRQTSGALPSLTKSLFNICDLDA